MRQYIISPYIQDSFNVNLYGLCRRRSKDYAESIGIELAEGPTLLVVNNIHGPVELWPIAIKEDENAVSG